MATQTTIAAALQDKIDAKAAIKTAIEAKGVTVGAVKLSDYAAKVGEIETTGDWIRPSDWLKIDSLITPGEQKIVGLVAIYPDNNSLGMKNSLGIYCHGKYTVDWGDGTVENFNSAVTAGHVYTYNNISSATYCARGYRQVIVTITPQSDQNLTAFYTYLKNSSTTGYTVNQYLDINISGTLFSSLQITASTAKLSLLEKVKIYQTSTALTTLSFSGASALIKLDITNLNIQSVTSLLYAFAYTFLSEIDLGGKNAQSVTSLASTFYRCYNLRKVIMPVTSGLLTSCTSTFRDCSFLIIADCTGLNMSNVTNTDNMFSGNNSLRYIDFSNTDLSKTTTTSTFSSCVSLETLRCPGISKTFVLTDANLSASALNTVFLDLKDLTGQTAQTITITGCPGAATCDKTIATNKNWTVIG